MIHTKWSKNILDALMLTNGGASGSQEKEQESKKLRLASFTYQSIPYSNINLFIIGKTNSVVTAVTQAANQHIQNSSHGDTLTEEKFAEYKAASDKNIYTSESDAKAGAQKAASNKKTELLTTMKTGVKEAWPDYNKLAWYKMVDDDLFENDPQQSYKTEPVVWYEKILKPDSMGTYQYQKRVAEDGIALKDKYFSSMKGWTFKAKSVRTYDYPKLSYIGLFTEMPEPDGTGYQEPPSTSTYQRMDLLNDIILGRGCLSDPIPHEEGGAESTNDNVQILFPEAYFTDDNAAWGTIKGFGVFETDQQDGTPPIFWDKLANDTELEIESGYVPLFRTGDFKVILQ